MMFSLLSQGYGTYDGTAKKDYQEIADQKVSNVTDHQSCTRIICSRRIHHVIFRVLLGINSGQKEVSDFKLLLRMILCKLLLEA